jgi:hypothetical protein
LEFLSGEVGVIGVGGLIGEEFQKHDKVFFDEVLDEDLFVAYVEGSTGFVSGGV